MGILFDNWITAITTLASIVGGLGVYFSQRKLRKAQADAEINTAVKGMVDIYRGLTQDVDAALRPFRERVIALEKESEAFKKQQEEQQGELEKYKDLVVTLEREVAKYRKKVSTYEKRIKELEKELKKYQK